MVVGDKTWHVNSHDPEVGELASTSSYISICDCMLTYAKFRRC